MSIQTIYAQLIKAGLSPVGACGLMGNMQAESAMRSNNAQDGMTRLSDDEYTAQVDNGSYTNFVKDAVGYGLCQWTYWTRKQALLNYAKSKGVSVGNEAMQVEFAIRELKEDYASLWSYLCTATGVYEAASRVCTEFERPAVNNIEVRAEAANQFYMTLGGMDVSNIKVSTEEVKNATEKTNGSWCNLKLPVLSKGSKSDYVRGAQILLIGNKCSCGVYGADGDFGNATKSAVEKFQKKKGLKADGVIGKNTWTALLK